MLAAIEEANADQVIVMPNAPTFVWQQAAASACEDVKVGIIPTKSVLQAFAAMFVVADGVPLKELVEEMTDAISGVRYGEVTTAVRDSSAAQRCSYPRGDVMGIPGENIDVVGFLMLCRSHLTLSLLRCKRREGEQPPAGEDFSDEQLDLLASRLRDTYPDLEVDAQRGGNRSIQSSSLLVKCLSQGKHRSRIRASSSTYLLTC